MNGLNRCWITLLFPLVFSGCFFEKDASDSLQSGTDLFDVNTVLEYDLSFKAADWSALSYEGKPLGILVDACNTF